MAKYSYEFKKEIVESYLNGEGGYKYLAKKAPRCVVSWAREIWLLVFYLYAIFLLSATILPHISENFSLYYPGGGFSIPEISNEYLAIIMTPFGGREIGKRLADELDIAYYDKEIVGEISKETGLNEEYIEKFGEKAVTRVYPYVFRATFNTYNNSVIDELHNVQAEVVRKLAIQGDCVVVGRCSDYILREYNPFKVFVYSSDERDKIARCDKMSGVFNEKEIIKQIHHIDKERAKYYFSYTGQKRGELKNYNFFIDTSAVSIKTAVQMIALAVRAKDE